MGTDPFENSDVNKSRFVSSVPTAAFVFEKTDIGHATPIMLSSYYA